MLNLVRQLITYLTRWVAKYEELSEHKKLPPKSHATFYTTEGELRLTEWLPTPYKKPPSRRNWKEIVASFGNPDWRPITDSALLRRGPGTRRWESKHMVLLRKLPGHAQWSARGLKKLYVNVAIADALVEALRRCVQLQEAGLIPAAWDLESLGCFNPRRVGYSRHANWSGHAYGIALDINPSTNGRGVVGTVPPAVVAAFKSCGFYWGGDYKTVKRDDMHLEWWR